MLDVVEVGWEGESEINSLTPTFSVSEVTWVVWGGAVIILWFVGGASCPPGTALRWGDLG